MIVLGERKIAISAYVSQMSGFAPIFIIQMLSNLIYLETAQK
jgi:hypothetical protein